MKFLADYFKNNKKVFLDSFFDGMLCSVQHYERNLEILKIKSDLQSIQDDWKRVGGYLNEAIAKTK